MVPAVNLPHYPECYDRFINYLRFKPFIGDE